MKLRDAGLVTWALVGAAHAAMAAEVVRVVTWDGPAGVPPAPEVRPVVVDGEPRLVVEVSGRETRIFNLARIDDPGVTPPAWRLEGSFQVENLEGGLQLEMWVVYANGARYFSRSNTWTGDSSPSSTGSVPFTLPFYPDPSSTLPTRLEVNLMLAGPGRVVLGPMRVVQLAAVTEMLAPAGSWWGAREGAILGATAGTVLGLLGAMLGLLMARGIGLRMASALLLAIGLAGVGALATGGYALATGQPHGVWFPLGLLGLIAAVVGFAMRPVAHQRLAMLEDQRMRAADL